MKSGDSSTLRAAEAVLSGAKKNPVASLLPFIGPAFIASVAYMDPGNFATNIQGGAKFGYLLLWVIAASNLMAMFIQAMSAKLGIATGRNLAEHCREAYSKPMVAIMWFLMELVAIATDLAEFLGAAVGFNLLFGFPLIAGGILTAAATFIILGLERRGFRPIEAVITALVGIIAACYLAETIMDRPDWGSIVSHAVVPRFAGTESVILATGILGATVMPHAIYLHSALTQGRIIVRDPAKLRRLFRFEVIDVVIAMGLASLINAAMLIMAASTFHRSGLTGVATLDEAHRTLEPLLGRAAGAVFAVSLLAAGLSSSAVGTSAGQVIMQGFLKRHVPPWVRRVVTMIPSIAVILAGLDPTRTLVISQVVLSFGLPFAIIPLVHFTSRKDLMGVLVNRKIAVFAGITVATLIVSLNVYLLYQTLFAR
jgi:manganese transport protein